ncbi:MAG: TetR/AcrR family transcriptional regulator [bacterium]
MSSDSAEGLSARDRILSVAGRLFYQHGYRAIGVDRVIAEAAVAKATFYRHFPSKDDLIVAWIAEAEAQSAFTAAGPEPLTAYAMAMIDVAGRPTCLGCTYQVSAAEFSDPAHPAHRAALGVKDRVIAALQDHARQQGVADPEAVAGMVFLLLEGVWAAKRMFGPDAPLAGAGEAVRRLISTGRVT